MTRKHKSKQGGQGDFSSAMSGQNENKGNINNGQMVGGVSDVGTLIRNVNETLYGHLPMASNMQMNQQITAHQPQMNMNQPESPIVNQNFPPNHPSRQNIQPPPYVRNVQPDNIPSNQFGRNEVNSNAGLPNTQNIRDTNVNVNTGFPQSNQANQDRSEQLATIALQCQQAMFSFMDQINYKITAVQNSVSKLDKIEKDMSSVQIAVSDLQTESAQTRKKLIDFDTFAQTSAAVCDDFLSSKQDYECKFREAKQENDLLKIELDELRQEHENLHENFLELQSRTMQRNLIFFGLDEVESPDQCEAFLKNFIKEELALSDTVNVDSISFEKVHRIGRRKNLRFVQPGQKQNPRPIVAVFERFSDREMIKNVASTLKGKNFSIREQFPVEIEQRRKPLYPVMRKALEDKNNKVKMVRDKLYINNTLYKPSNSNSQVTNRDTNGQSFNFRGQHSRTYSNKSQVNVRTPYRSNFKPTRQPATQLHDFTTPNRFTSLSRSDSSQSLPNMQQKSVKKKATSPLEADVQNKKPREELSSIEINPETDLEMTAQIDHRSSDSEIFIPNTLNQQGETQSPQLTVTAEIHSTQLDPGSDDIIEHIA